MAGVDEIKRRLRVESTCPILHFPTLYLTHFLEGDCPLFRESCCHFQKDTLGPFWILHVARTAKQIDWQNHAPVPVLAPQNHNAIVAYQVFLGPYIYLYLCLCLEVVLALERPRPPIRKLFTGTISQTVYVHSCRAIWQTSLKLSAESCICDLDCTL